MLRLKWICTENEDYLKHVLIICCHFMRRGYLVQLLNDAIIKASKINRLDLLEKERQCGLDMYMEKMMKENRLFLITTFNPGFSGLKSIVQQNWDLLHRSSTTKLLAETRITFGHRCLQNLKDLLVRAKVPKPRTEKRLTPHCKFAKRCNNEKCQFCPILDRSGSLVSSFTGREYQ